MRSDRYKNESAGKHDASGSTPAANPPEQPVSSPEPAKKRKKKHPVRDFLYRLVMFILLVVICVSGYKIYQTVSEYLKARNTYNAVSQTAHVDPNQFTGVVDFDELLKINPDVQGWLYQKDTVINYPVVQGRDNEQYLHTLVDGTWGGGGTLFVDFRNQPDFQDFNSIIYGHHMKDGSMFRCLRGYTKEKNYYSSHKQLELITPNAKYHLLVFSAYITPADSELAYKLFFDSDAEKRDYLDQTFAASQITTDLSRDDVDVSDKIITLSTCAYDYEEARYVVICKAVPWTEEEIAAGKKLQMQIDEQEGR
ncbi:MAG: class B sortase [Mogibacterium sp.]|nr:class B sortase [Mogibacterium sp.]